jgi:hypothetical protein
MLAAIVGLIGAVVALRGAFIQVRDSQDDFIGDLRRPPMGFLGRFLCLRCQRGDRHHRDDPVRRAKLRLIRV